MASSNPPPPVPVFDTAPVWIKTNNNFYREGYIVKVNNVPAERMMGFLSLWSSDGKDCLSLPPQSTPPGTPNLLQDCTCSSNLHRIRDNDDTGYLKFDIVKIPAAGSYKIQIAVITVVGPNQNRGVGWSGVVQVTDHEEVPQAHQQAKAHRGKKMMCGS